MSAPGNFDGTAGRMTGIILRFDANTLDEVFADFKVFSRGVEGKAGFSGGSEPLAHPKVVCATTMEELAIVARTGLVFSRLSCIVVDVVPPDCCGWSEVCRDEVSSIAKVKANFRFHRIPPSEDSEESSEWLRPREEGWLLGIADFEAFDLDVGLEEKVCNSRSEGFLLSLSFSSTAFPVT